MQYIYKHVTITFAVERWVNNRKGRTKDDIRDEVCKLFNTTPTRESSGSVVWMQGGDPHCFYYDVTQRKLS